MEELDPGVRPTTVEGDDAPDTIVEGLTDAEVDCVIAVEGLALIVIDCIICEGD